MKSSLQNVWIAPWTGITEEHVNMFIKANIRALLGIDFAALIDPHGAVRVVKDRTGRMAKIYPDLPTMLTSLAVACDRSIRS